MLNLEITPIDNSTEKQVSDLYLTCNDSEIVMLFLHLCQIYGDKTEDDF